MILTYNFEDRMGRNVEYDYEVDDTMDDLEEFLSDYYGHDLNKSYKDGVDDVYDFIDAIIPDKYNPFVCLEEDENYVEFLKDKYLEQARDQYEDEQEEERELDSLPR